jgi:hypothetical protein
VVDYFRRNPLETITADDMYVKFSLRRAANIRMELLDAYSTDTLARREVNGEYEYSAGKRLLAELADTATTKPARKAASRKTTNLPASAKPATVADFPDPLAVPIESGIPHTSLRGVRADWTLLLARLQVDQSAKLPWRCYSTLGKTITEWHKTNAAKFITKKYPDTQELRVWRVA